MYMPEQTKKNLAVSSNWTRNVFVCKKPGLLHANWSRNLHSTKWALLSRFSALYFHILPHINMTFCILCCWCDQVLSCICTHLHITADLEVLASRHNSSRLLQEWCDSHGIYIAPDNLVTSAMYFQDREKQSTNLKTFTGTIAVKSDNPS